MNDTTLTESLYYILLSVKAANHGYGIMESIRQMTGGRVSMGPGTLYGGINTLLGRGYIRLYSSQEDSRKKKEYILTPEGEEALRREMDRLNELIENGKKVLG